MPEAVVEERPRWRRGAPLRVPPVSTHPVRIDPRKAAAFTPPEVQEAAPQGASAGAGISRPEATVEAGNAGISSPRAGISNPEGGLEAGTDGTVKQMATPVKQGIDAVPISSLPFDDSSILNNLVAREYVAPTDGLEATDVSLIVMEEVVRAALEGRDLTVLEERIKAVSAMMQDKHELLDAIINGPHALHEKHSWVQLRARTHRQIRQAACRGDLTTAELLVVARLSNEMVQQIDKEIRTSTPSDPLSVVQRIESNRKRANEEATTFEGTTIQGREIIRKQIYLIRKKVKEHRETQARLSSRTE